MEPIGMPLKVLSSNHCVDILGVLAELHHLNLVHRDIRPDNVLRTADDDALLVDFGFVVPANHPTPYCGAAHYASHRILESMIKGNHDIACTPMDDLVSLVRTAFAICFPLFRKRLELIPRHKW